MPTEAVRQITTYRLYVNEYKAPYGGTVARHMRHTADTLQEARNHARTDVRVREFGGEIIQTVVTHTLVQTIAPEGE